MSTRQAPYDGIRSGVAVLICIAALGCANGPSRAPDPTVDLHRELLRQANDEYTLERAASSVTTSEVYSDPINKVKNIQLFSFSMSNPNVSAPPRFVAAFLSTKKHTPMGLEKGMNFILEVMKADGTKGYVVVPEDEKTDMSFLKVLAVKNDPNGAPPHVIRNKIGTVTSGTRTDVEYAIGGCIEGCATGHCGFSRTDGVFTASVASLWGVRVPTH